MRVLRTPDERFQRLPGYDFAPHYVDADDFEGGSLRIHYIEERPSRTSGETILCLHGEPSWSYLYRKMIPVFTAAGHRVIAPDIVGFGRSDKPTTRQDYTYQRHVDWMRIVLESLDLDDLTLVCQDWGGLIGLRLAAEHPDRFKRIVAANTMLPTGDNEPGEAFMNWQKFSQDVPTFPVGDIVAGGCARDLEDAVKAAYDAPFPDESYKEGARQFPLLVPIRPDDPASDANRKAWEVLSSWQKPFLTAFSDSDPITAGGEKVLQARIPGTRSVQHATIKNAGHFLQEDQGEDLANVVVGFISQH